MFDFISRSFVGHRSASPPKIISMAMTSRCNLRCVMCDHAVRNVEKQDFDPDLIEKIGDFIAKAQIVDLTGLGEPTLSALFWKIVDKFPHNGDDAEPFLMFNTNAVLLDAPRIDRILNSKMRRIRVSIDSPDSATFDVIRKTDLSKVVANTKSLMAARNKTGRKMPVIGIEMTIMRRNLHQMSDMLDLAKEIGVDFVEFWSINDMAPDAAKAWVIQTKGNPFVYGDELLSSLDRNYLDRLVEESTTYALSVGMPAAFIILGKGSGTPDYPKNIPSSNPTPVAWKANSIRCDLPWKEMRASYTGDVTACCWGPRPVGSLKKNTMQEIWNSKAMIDTRRDLVNGNVPRACKGATCQYLAGHRGKKGI